MAGEVTVKVTAGAWMRSMWGWRLDGDGAGMAAARRVACRKASTGPGVDKKLL
jgi:hypothetical protein